MMDLLKSPQPFFEGRRLLIGELGRRIIARWRGANCAPLDEPEHSHWLSWMRLSAQFLPPE